MHLAAGRDLGHLTYCTNVHPGESLAEVTRNLQLHTSQVKQGFCPDQPLSFIAPQNGEVTALLLGRTWGFPVVAFRPFGVFGPQQSLGNHTH